MQRTHTRLLIATVFSILIVACSDDAADIADRGETAVESDTTSDDGARANTRRTPAEWELQAAIWMQWPQAYEGRAIEEEFVSIVEVIVEYEHVHLLAADEQTLNRGNAALARVDDSNITWHVVPNDNSWMRDNGPRYVEVDGELVAQNWEFDAWGRRVRQMGSL